MEKGSDSKKVYSQRLGFTLRTELPRQERDSVAVLTVIAVEVERHSLEASRGGCWLLYHCHLK